MSAVIEVVDQTWGNDDITGTFFENTKADMKGAVVRIVDGAVKFFLSNGVLPVYPDLNRLEAFPTYLIVTTVGETDDVYAVLMQWKYPADECHYATLVRGTVTTLGETA